MVSRRPILPLTIGMIVSLVLHGAILLPGLTRVANGGQERSVLSARFDPDSFIQEPDDTIQLGIETEETRTSLTWIGYDEYEKHMAELSATEQAAFKTESVPESLPLPEPAQPQEQPVEAASAAAGLLIELGARLEAMRRGEGPAVPFGAAANPSPIERILAELADVAAEPTDAVAPAKTVAAKPANPTPPTEQTARDEEPADVRDLESPATSTLEIAWKDIQLGKPLAATGLEVKPRRPAFTTLTRLTAAPANPLVRIHFASDGVPEHAEIMSTSGDSRVDEAILNSLYRWRASGKRIEALAGERTLPLEIRIVLSRN